MIATSSATSMVALLGPTNTGKTHRAVERMLEHDTGMIGLPLRLLAREIYDRVTARIGELEVALVTGEEKRIPARPRYWICTTEAMPLDRSVDFVAVDEVQLCAHPQRGHVFTDRLLNARGQRETWFMGADTIRPTLAELVPTASIRRHPRFSRLQAAEASALSSLPPRTALIAFSAAEVYELADRLRSRRGGAAVVLGALSPRTRNAQVAMYQAGEVDFLVATDAIGMGLNMDVDHVAFASLHKFDGKLSRGLAPDELGQIAGRAGRHVRDGTFGTLTPLTMDGDLAFAVENHRYAPIRRVVWRNSDLEFQSIAALMASLRQKPSRRILQLVEHADDFAALSLLSERPEITTRAHGSDAVRLLWQVCQIPDFRKLLVEHHASLLAEIFLALCESGGRLAPELMERHVRRLESAEGDIDTLLSRLELIRTWSYVAHRSEWLDRASAWQQRTIQAEDDVSRALHQRLIERFVARPGRGRRARPRRAKDSGAQRQRGPTPGLAPGETERFGPFAKLAALYHSLPGGESSRDSDGWVEDVVAAPFERFDLDAAGTIAFDGQRVAQLIRGADITHPEVKLAVDRHLAEGERLTLLRRMRAHARDLVETLLAPFAVPLAEIAAPAARGLGYQLEQSLGTVLTRGASAQLAGLTRDEIRRLEAEGLRFGRRVIYAKPLLDARAITRRIALCSAWLERRPALALEPGDVAGSRSAGVAAATYLCCGYAELGGIFVRADALERMIDELDAIASGGPFRCPDELASTLGRSLDEIEGAIIALGFAQTEAGFVRLR
jgi:ATP-dependent RNA helicase SUPV3L1/SUV3